MNSNWSYSLEMPNIGQNWKVFGLCDLEIWQMALNKATLRDLIAVTGLIILLKLDSNRRLISLCDLEIWWMTSKNNKASLIFYIELCASFQTRQWIQTGVTVRKRPIWVKFDDFYSCVTLEFDGWPWKTIGHLYYATQSSMHHSFRSHRWIQAGLQSGNAQFG